jgi:hypothetical protein
MFLHLKAFSRLMSLEQNDPYRGYIVLFAFPYALFPHDVKIFVEVLKQMRVRPCGIFIQEV